MKSYEVPEWGGRSTITYDTPFYLEVVKDGVSIEEIPITKHPQFIKNPEKSFLLCGRQGDIVDVILENPSTSRQHAIIQLHQQDGSLYLYDLGSAQGTYINKIQLTPYTYQLLYVGDMIKFAASSRSYIIMGPEQFQRQEYNSPNLQLYREKRQQHTQQMEQKLSSSSYSKEEENYVSWGMDFDEYNVTTEDDDMDIHDTNKTINKNKNKSIIPPYMMKGSQYRDGEDADSNNINKTSSSSVKDRIQQYIDTHSSSSIHTNDHDNTSKMTSKDDIHHLKVDNHHLKSDDKEKSIPQLSKTQQIFIEKIQMKERKIDMLQQEIRRIQQKELSQDNGLSDGQLKTIERNETLIEQLSMEIETLLQEQEWKEMSSSSTNKLSKTMSKNKNGHSQKDKYNDNNDDEDNNIYDMTSETIDISTNWRIKKKKHLSHTIQTQVLEDIQQTESTSASDVGVGSMVLTYDNLLHQKTIYDKELTNVHLEIHALQSKLTEYDTQLNTLRTDTSIQKDENIDIKIMLIQSEQKEEHIKLIQYNNKVTLLNEKLQYVTKYLNITKPALKSLTTSTATTITNTTTASTNNSVIGASSDTPVNKTIDRNTDTKVNVCTVNTLDVMTQSKDDLKLMTQMTSTSTTDNNDTTLKCDIINSSKKDISSLSDTDITLNIQDKLVSKPDINKTPNVVSIPDHLNTSEVVHVDKKLEDKKDNKMFQDNKKEFRSQISPPISTSTSNSNNDSNRNNSDTCSNNIDSHHSTTNAISTVSNDREQKRRKIIQGPTYDKDGTTNTMKIPSSTNMKSIDNSISSVVDISCTDGNTGMSYDQLSHRLQDGEYAWVPPTGQSGSGRTKLNDKYGY